MIKNIQNLNTQKKGGISIEKIKKYLPKFQPNWRGALSVVLFFGASFLLVAVFLGLRFVMTASVITVLFQIRHARYNSWEYLLRQLVICKTLALFAIIATLDTPLSLLLNFIIPFALFSCNLHNSRQKDILPAP